MVHCPTPLVNYTLDPGLPVTRLQCHPLILDGSDYVPPALRRDRSRLTPTTRVGKCACTFYLVFKEPVLPAPPSGYFVVRGTLQSYVKPSLAVNPQPPFAVATSFPMSVRSTDKATVGLRALRGLRRLSPPARSRSVSTNIRGAATHCQPRPFPLARLFATQTREVLGAESLRQARP
jgi:hypothetical protein